MTSRIKGFMARHGMALVSAGYNIIPIKRGSKRPPFYGWESLRADKAQVRKWLDEGQGRNGIGIIAANTPGVDLDIQDEELALFMEAWIHDHVAMAPVRLGFAPKRLLMFRTDEPFKKMKSQVYEDGEGRQQQVEILGDGQQFVAYHIHPDSNLPYEWLYKDGPLVTPHADLPELTVEMAKAIVEEFERQAAARGWKPKKRLQSKSPARNVDDDDPFAADTQVADISDEDLHAKLLRVAGAEDYDTWLQIGMALYHQFGGVERGLELWHEWSSYADNYDPDALDEKWKTFDISEKGRAPVTARMIIKLAKEAEEIAATETAEEMAKLLREANNITELKAAAEKVKKAELDTLARENIVGILRERFKLVTGQGLGLRAARDMVRYENPNAKALPRWLEDWIYVSGEDKLYNLRSREVMSQTSFNTTFARFMLTKKDLLEGRAMPERRPVDVAMNIHQIPVVDRRSYMPGLDEIFTINGVRCANTYNDRNVPEVPDEISHKDKRNVERVKAHFTHLFTDEKESRIFLDYLAFVVQNPGKRPNWAVLLQGTEGDGKTFFGYLLGAMLGAENVRMLNAKTVQGDFNGWAEGQQVVFVEEIRLHGHNRYDVLNQIKPLITNEVVEIHRKGVDPYNIHNTSAYILATNYRDALPLTENDSRYFVLFSRFQTKEALDAFKEDHPTYYEDLYQAVSESPGALRGWLLEHETGPNFSANNRAPESRAKGYMAMITKSEEQAAIEQLIQNSMRFDISRELLNATDLVDELMDMDDIEVPQTRTINKMLSDTGFTFLNRVKVEGKFKRFWSQFPERFMRGGEVDNDAIRRWATMRL